MGDKVIPGTNESTGAEDSDYSMLGTVKTGSVFTTRSMITTCCSVGFALPTFIVISRQNEHLDVKRVSTKKRGGT